MILRKAQRGFTLVEVMIAMAILAGGLVLLLRSTASNIFSANRARMLTAATNLARAKMYDLEEVLLEEGFQERDLVEEGDFADQGWPKITWKAEIIRIELPDMSTLAGMTGGEEGEGGEGGGGMLGGITGQPGTASEAADAGIMGSYYGMISEVLSESIRKVDLTISYPVVNEIESFVVTCYFTDPSAVNRKIPFAGGGGGAGGDTGDSGDSDDSGDSSGTGGGSGRTPTVTPSGGRGGDR